MIHIFQPRWRSSRRLEKVRNGSIDERVLAMIHLPGICLSTAAAAAAAIKVSGRPARSASLSITSWPFSSSHNWFWLKVV